MHRLTPFVSIDILKAGCPDGMRGCGRCQFGLINPPPLNVAASVYITRTVQASLGMLTFCTCAAGVRYRRHLVGSYRSMRDGADSTSPAFTAKVTAEVRAQMAPEPEHELSDDEILMPTLNGEVVEYAR